jgi:hypothetical protein
MTGVGPKEPGTEGMPKPIVSIAQTFEKEAVFWDSMAARKDFFQGSGPDMDFGKRRA